MSLSSLLLVVAFFLACVLTAVGFGWITSSYPFGWLGLTLVFYLASLLVDSLRGTVAR